MRWLRWTLLGGWLLLILSLLWPVAAGLPQHPGNRVFWGTVVPVGLLLIGVASHEIWRRICPLAFVSLLPRALGRQRTRPGRRGKPEVVLVDPGSWLGRHHVGVQWTLLIAGLCLRLLAVNGSPLGLALLLIVTVTAAVLVGWAWGGKAWCQYVCPMGPVQTVLTGLRGPLGSPAHVGTSSRVTQSMCRTIASDGREQSVCVACQSPCIDVDAERAFWQTLSGKRSLGWAWFSYPGLIWAFFLLMGQLGRGPAVFATDQPARIWQPLPAMLPLPRLLAVPLLLSASATASVLLFQAVEGWLLSRYGRQGRQEPRQLAVQHTRLLASFVAINLFFWFVDPLQGLAGPHGGQVLRTLVLLASSIALYRGWGRDQATYRRESASEGLRRQLRNLPGLEAALDGRSLETLSPQEVFTLVRAMPALGRQQGRDVYRNVLTGMLQSGRLDQARALLDLAELRSTLQLEDADHHAVVRLLAQEHPELQQWDPLQRQRDDLRHEAAAEAVDQLLRQSGQEVLDPDRLPTATREQLQQLEQTSGLDADQWQALLDLHGPRGALERQRLQRWRDDWTEEAGLAARLAQLAQGDGLLQPLAVAMQQRSDDRRHTLAPRLEAAGLEPLPATVPAAGRLDDACERLWHDPDPDTAGWVLMLARERDPGLAARLSQQLRGDLSDSPFLQRQQRGEDDGGRDHLAGLAGAGLFADLLPAGLLWVSRQGWRRSLAPGEVAVEAGAASDSLALVLRGALQLTDAGGETVRLGPGDTVGEMGVITGRPRSVTVIAADDGAELFELPAGAFDDLLRRSPGFDRALLASLAERLTPMSVR